jgi:hypothetical protein
MLENARILAKLRTIDPDYYDRNLRTIKRRISMSLLDAAQQIGETKRGPALALWCRSVTEADTGAAIRALLRLLVPRSILNVLRTIKHRIRHGQKQA